MRTFDRIFSVTTAAVLAVGLSATGAFADVIPTSDMTVTTPGNFLGNSVLAIDNGGALNTYAIPFNAATASTCGVDNCTPSPTVPGYVGSQDLQFTVSTMNPSDQTVTWGTTNGNPGPLNSVGALGLVYDGIGNLNGGGSLFGYTGSSTDPLSSFGVSNGYWDASMGAFIGVNNDANGACSADMSNCGNGNIDSIFLYFSNPIAGFAAYFNYNSDQSSTPSIIAYGADGIAVASGGNDSVFITNPSPILNEAGNGAFVIGMLDPNGVGGLTNDISVIQLTDGYAALAGLVVAYAGDHPAAVPEPMSLALLGSGLVALGAARRRMKKN